MPQITDAEIEDRLRVHPPSDATSQQLVDFAIVRAGFFQLFTTVRAHSLASRTQTHSYTRLEEAFGHACKAIWPRQTDIRRRGDGHPRGSGAELPPAERMTT